MKLTQLAPTYKEKVQHETLTQLEHLSCSQYYNGQMFDKFYSQFVKQGMKAISTLGIEIADKIIRTSPPMEWADVEM